MNIFQTIKNIKRLKSIIVALLQYGFGEVIAELRIVPLFSVVNAFLRLVFGRKGAGLSVQVRLRMVLEELGPTFVKLGQIASTRADLLPPEWIEEFKKLQDMVSPFPFHQVRATVEKALKAPLSSRFSSFDETPVASASIAQVHFAALLDGTKVAVKVRRPDIADVIESDISVMMTFAGLLEKYVPASIRYRPREVVSEFARVIGSEQDLTIEGVNCNRFHTIFKDNPNIQIPVVYWDYTTVDVLTMEHVYGTPIDEVATLRAKGLDIRDVAIRGLEIFFKQVFEHGIFHADLHPGNIFVRDDGVIIYLDFGIIGRLDANLRKYLAALLYHLIRRDYHNMARIHREMGLIGKDVDMHEFEEALRDIAEPVFGMTLEQINISTLLVKLISTARRFNMVLQPNLLLLQKSMVIIEGVGRQLYPDIDIWNVARPLVTRWMLKEKFSVGKAVKKGADNIHDIAEAAFELPGQMHEILKRALSEELKIGFVHHRLDPVTDELNNAGRRIGGAGIAASLILSATLAAVFYDKDADRLLGLPYLSWAGYLIALIVSLRAFGAGASKNTREP